MTQFFMPMVPPTATHQMKKIMVRNGKPIVYEPPEVKEARSKLMSHLSQHVPEQPYRSGVQLVVKWLFPVAGNHKSGSYKITKPDTDNLQKMLKDCMTQLNYWTDDALVCSEVCEKFYNDPSGIFIHIEEVD